MKGRNGERGFTFVEALLAIAIMGAMIQVLYHLYLSNFQVWQAVDARAGVRQDAGWAMERMTRVLRGTREITGAGTNQITFWWRDLDGDEVHDANETVSYSWSGVPGEGLYRTTSSAAVNLAGNVKNFHLEYRDGNNNILPFPELQLADIRHITISLEIENEGESIALRSSIRPRNL